MYGRQKMMRANRWHQPTLTLVAILAIFAMALSACVVDPNAVELTVDVDIRAAGDARARNDDTVEILGTNEAGEQLLPRVLNGSFENDDCVIDLSALANEPDCGWLTRPLHGAYSDDIELPVMIFRSPSADPSETPLVYLHGGPSDGVLTYFDPEVAFDPAYTYEVLVEPWIENRDVILFDQRGTGLAKPDLGCDGARDWFNAYDEDPATFVPRTTSICASSLRLEGIRMDQFSRQSSADDVAVLARELGYEAVDLHGSSWGGILSYTVMQLHPTVVRSAVLDSPLSIETDLTGSMPGSFREAMQGMQANCDLSASCRARHGDIIARYIRVFEQLEANPAEIMIFDVFSLELSADDLSYLLFGLFYSPEAIAMIPDLLLDLENGNYSLLQELTNEHGWGWGVDFTFLTYMCTDIVAASTPEDVEAQQIGIEAFDRVDDAPDGRGHTAQAMCERMQVRNPPNPAPQEVVPTTPTIVFAGSMDPITPLSSGRQIIEDIPNGIFVGFNDLSHGVTTDPCAVSIALEFLDDPETEPDLTCSLPENRPPFQFVQVARTVPSS